MNNENLRFMSTSSLVTVDSPIYRPPSFPPPDEWAVSVDEKGNALSRYGSDFWDFRAFERSATFNFMKDSISDGNVHLIKRVMFLVLYHPRLFPGKIRSCVYPFSCLTRIAKVCDKYSVSIAELSRFPRIHSEVAEALQCSFYKVYVNFLHKLRLHAEELGFEILDERALAYLVSQQGNQETVQTPYIPPRIWTYQVKRLGECIDDYLRHQEAIEQAYGWISTAYKHNSLSAPPKFESPFYGPEFYRNRRIVFLGGFNDFLAEHHLLELFEKWLGTTRQPRISRFTAYMNMVREASLFYILSFSLQRLSEAASLRSDCYVVERDERLGDVAMVVGETTRTDPDNDARWVVPSTVRKAVEAASSIAKLRLRHFPVGDSPLGSADGSVPLMLAATEPWNPNKSKYRNSKGEMVSQLRLGPFMALYPRMFDPEEISVTEQDWRIAVSMTPNIALRSEFGVGLPWPFAAHQLRRTTNVNMYASNMVSDNSLQWIMKHVSHKMTAYYGRNHTNLRMNSDAETAVVVESYQAIYRQLVAVVADSVEHVRPHSKEMIPPKVINLIEARDEKQLTKLIEQGAVGCRRTLLGFCMKPGFCEYGGIESVAQCAGGEGQGVCADAIFGRKNEPKLLKLKAVHEREIESLDSRSPRFGALKKEIYAIEVYLDVITR